MSFGWSSVFRILYDLTASHRKATTMKTPISRIVISASPRINLSNLIPTSKFPATCSSGDAAIDIADAISKMKLGVLFGTINVNESAKLLSTNGRMSYLRKISAAVSRLERRYKTLKNPDFGQPTTDPFCSLQQFRYCSISVSKSCSSATSVGTVAPHLGCTRRLECSVASGAVMDSQVHLRGKRANCDPPTKRLIQPRRPWRSAASGC
jgi:hypothetical protein